MFVFHTLSYIILIAFNNAFITDIIENSSSRISVLQGNNNAFNNTVLILKKKNCFNKGKISSSFVIQST